MIIRNPEPMPTKQKVLAWVIFIAIITLVASFVVFAIKTQEDQNHGIVPSSIRVYGIGDAFLVGNIQFVVQGAKEMQNYNGHKTSGKFVVVEVSAKNIGQSPATVDGGMFILWDGLGRKYENNGVNDISFADDKYFSIDQLNPGIMKEGRVSFEVPSDASGFRLGVRSNMFDFGGAEYQYVDLK